MIGVVFETQARRSRGRANYSDWLLGFDHRGPRLKPGRVLIIFTPQRGWRVTALLQISEKTKTVTRIASMVVEELAKLLKDETDIVVLAFEKLTERLLGRQYFYLQPEYVKPILKEGLPSQQEATHRPR